MSDLISRQEAIEAIASRDETDGTVKVFTGREVNEILSALPSADIEEDVARRIATIIENEQDMRVILKNADGPTGWIPCSERMPEHSYTKRFWLTVKLDDGTITTLIGTWGAWCGCNDSKSYDAFNCWKDTMINGGIYRLSQPIPKEQVLAWMPAPEPYREDGEA